MGDRGAGAPGTGLLEDRGLGQEGPCAGRHRLLLCCVWLGPPCEYNPGITREPLLIIDQYTGDLEVCQIR